MYYQPVKFNLTTLYTQFVALCGGLSTAQPMRNIRCDNGDTVRVLELSRSAAMIRVYVQVNPRDEVEFTTELRVYPGQRTAYGVRLSRNYGDALVTLKKEPGFNVGAYTEINDFLYRWLADATRVEWPHRVAVGAVA